MPDGWETIVRLTGIVSGLGAEADVDELDRALALDTLRRRTSDPWSPVAGRDPEELLGMLEPRTGQERMLDVMLRCGPHGDHFGARPEGLTLARLEAHPHGIDLGPLEPRLPDALRTPSGTVELGHPLLLAEGERLEQALSEPVPPLVLIGRREHRSLNSWLHNLPALAGGRRRCTLLVHPDDADRLGLADGGRATVRSRVGEIELEVEVSDEMMPGVVSVPHGFGHGRPGTRLAVAAAAPGASVNDITDERLVDPVSGTVALNGVPVEVALPSTVATDLGLRAGDLVEAQSRLDPTHHVTARVVGTYAPEGTASAFWWGDPLATAGAGPFVTTRESFDALGLRDQSLRWRVAPDTRRLSLGEAAAVIRRALAGVVPLKDCGTVQAAVRCAAEAARPSEVVLLAPGCASFDQYRNFEERGDDFARAVAGLA